MGSTTQPTKCQNCGYSQRYSRQKPEEVLLYCGTCRHWMCEACRDLRGCAESNHPVVATPVVSDLLPGIPANDGIYAHISDLVYHADPDSLSSSGARLLTPPSVPALYRQAQDTPPDPKRAYDFGHAAHKMVLGEGSQLVMLDPAKHGLTKDGKLSPKPSSCGLWIATAQKARNEGKIPMAKAEIQKAQRMAGVVHTHPIAQRLLVEGTPEVSGYWHDDETGIRCRFRPDFLPDRPGRMICVDYKTAQSANPSAFERAAGDYGYHQQVAWYLDGLREVGISDDAAFLFIVQEKTPPYLMSLVQLDPEHVELGRRQNRRALETFAKCTAEKVWPGYGDGIHLAKLPAWTVKRIEADLDAELSTLTEG